MFQNCIIFEIFEKLASNQESFNNLAKSIVEAGLQEGNAARLVDDLLSKEGGDLLERLTQGGLEVLKAWQRLIDAPVGIKLNLIFLEEVSKWPSSWQIKVGRVVGTIEVFENGTPLARIFPDRVVASGRSVIGQPGNKILNRVPLMKNMVYEVDRIEYIVDEYGCAIGASTDLDDYVRIRLGNQQIRAVDIEEGISGDQGGHLIASRFFGPGEQINLVAQAGVLNQGAW